MTLSQWMIYSLSALGWTCAEGVWLNASLHSTTPPPHIQPQTPLSRTRLKRGHREERLSSNSESCRAQGVSSVTGDEGRKDPQIALRDMLTPCLPYLLELISLQPFIKENESQLVEESLSTELVEALCFWNPLHQTVRSVIRGICDILYRSFQQGRSSGQEHMPSVDHSRGFSGGNRDYCEFTLIVFIPNQIWNIAIILVAHLEYYHVPLIQCSAKWTPGLLCKYLRH